MFSQVYCAIVTQLDSENVIKKRNMAVTLVGSRLELLFFFFKVSTAGQTLSC